MASSLNKVQKRHKAKTELKSDAMALAELIYDVYKEHRTNANMINGQNNAQLNRN